MDVGLRAAVDVAEEDCMHSDTSTKVGLYKVTVEVMEREEGISSDNSMKVGLYEVGVLHALRQEAAA